MERTPQLALQWGVGEPGAEAREEPGRYLSERAVGSPAGSSETHPELTHAIENDVVPQLVRDHRKQVALAVPAVRRIVAADVAAFTQVVLTGSVEQAAAMVEALRAQGVTLETVYLELFEPTARRLGVLWEEDVCDFTEVTVGLGRMQQVLCDVSNDFRAESGCMANGRRLLLVPAPGEQHTLGLFMVADFFAREGWDVWGGPGAPDGQVFGLVRAEHFDVVGLSVGCETRIEVLAADIRKVRAASRNPALCIMVGGPLFVAHPDCVGLVGADAMATSGAQAPAAALALVARKLAQN